MKQKNLLCAIGYLLTTVFFTGCVSVGSQKPAQEVEFYLAQKNYDGCIREFTSAINYYQGSQSSEHPSPVKYKTAVREARTDMGYLWSSRGTCYFHKGLYDQAIEDFTQALRINPQDDKALTLRGLAYKQLKNYQQAASDLRQALAINPQNEQAKEELTKLEQQPRGEGGGGMQKTLQDILKELQKEE